MASAKQKILQDYEKYCREIDALLGSLSGLEEARLNRCPPKGGWSALQTLHHLLLAETVSLRSVQKKLARSVIPNPPAWDAGLRLWLMLALLRSPVKFKAPDSVGREKLPERSSLEELTRQWLGLRAEWTHFWQDMPEAWVDKAVYRHPRAGYIGWSGLVAFFRAHAQRHRRQVKRMLKVS